MENVKRRNELEKQAEILEKKLAKGEANVKKIMQDMEETDAKIQKERMNIKRIEKLEKEIDIQIQMDKMNLKSIEELEKDINDLQQIISEAKQRHSAIKE